MSVSRPIESQKNIEIERLPLPQSLPISTTLANPESSDNLRLPPPLQSRPMSAMVSQLSKNSQANQLQNNIWKNIPPYSINPRTNISYEIYYTEGSKYRRVLSEADMAENIKHGWPNNHNVPYRCAISVYRMSASGKRNLDKAVHVDTGEVLTPDMLLENIAQGWPIKSDNLPHPCKVISRQAICNRNRKRAFLSVKKTDNKKHIHTQGIHKNNNEPSIEVKEHATENTVIVPLQLSETISQQKESILLQTTNQIKELQENNAKQQELIVQQQTQIQSMLAEQKKLKEEINQLKLRNIQLTNTGDLQPQFFSRHITHPQLGNPLFFNSTQSEKKNEISSVIKKEPIDDQYLHPISVDKIREVAKKLREGNNAQENCIFLAHDMIRYFQTGIEPKQPSITRPATQEECDWEPITASHVVKKETGTNNISTKHAQVTQVIGAAAIITPEGPYRNIPQPSHSFIDMTQSEGKAIEKPLIDLEAVKHHQANARYDKINEVLKNQALNSGGVVFGKIGLARVNNHILKGHEIAFYATPDKVIYIDPQCYDGVKKKGDPVFFNLTDIDSLTKKPYFQFVGTSKTVQADTFSDRCFYIIYPKFNFSNTQSNDNEIVNNRLQM